MKVKLKNNNIVCPQCHTCLEVEGEDLRYEKDLYWTGNFFFKEFEIRRAVDESPALRDNLKFKKSVFDELMAIAPFARKAEIDCIYGGLDDTNRVFVVCPICGKDITIMSAEGNALRVTASGKREDLDSEEYYHANKVYTFDNCVDEFEVELTFSKKHPELYDTLSNYGYTIS